MLCALFPFFSVVCEQTGPGKAGSFFRYALHYFAIFCCSDAGDAIISGTTSAFTPQKWDSAVLMPEMLPFMALLEHSYSFEISRLLRQPLLKTNRSGTHGEVGLFISFFMLLPPWRIARIDIFHKNLSVSSAGWIMSTFFDRLASIQQLAISSRWRPHALNRTVWSNPEENHPK